MVPQVRPIKPYQSLELTYDDHSGAVPHLRGSASWEPETCAPMSMLSKLSEILAPKRAGQPGGLMQTSL